MDVRAGGQILEEGSHSQDVGALRGRRICVITSSHPISDTRIFRKEIRSLQSAGGEIIFVAPHAEDVTIEGVRILAITPGRSRIERWLLCPLRAWNRARGTDADVFHFHDPELVPIGLLLKAVGHRVIYDVHEDLGRNLLGKEWMHPVLRRSVAAIAEFVHQWCTARFDAVIVAREDIRVAQPRNGSLAVVSNYPSLSEFPPPAIRRDNDPFTVTYVGAISRQRGVLETLRALHLIPSDFRVRFLVCGRFSDAELEAEARDLARDVDVAFTGHLPYAEMIARAAECHAGVVCFLPEPNHINSGPTKLFEYMALGLPVVASDFPQWREVLAACDGGELVDPTQPRAIANAIVHLVHDRQRSAERGRSARRLIETSLNWESEVPDLIGVYSAVL